MAARQLASVLILGGGGNWSNGGTNAISQAIPDHLTKGVHLPAQDVIHGDHQRDRRTLVAQGQRYLGLHGSGAISCQDGQTCDLEHGSSLCGGLAGRA